MMSEQSGPEEALTFERWWENHYRDLAQIFQSRPPSPATAAGQARSIAGAAWDVAVRQAKAQINKALGMPVEDFAKVRSVQPWWALALPIQQQSVLFLAARGPDGVAKLHPCKSVQRAYRGTILIAAKFGRPLRWGEKADSFMGLDEFADPEKWALCMRDFFHHVDSLPHHFTMHLLHGAEILGYKHPDTRFRGRWFQFYERGAEDLHLGLETEEEMDVRLSDWGHKFWED